jgi:hypothetical protein
MFFNKPGKATPLKKVVYAVSATVLGLLLSFLVHSFIEIRYLYWALENHHKVTFYGNCALPPSLQLGLATLGAFGGYLLGLYWWRKLYVERVLESVGRNISTGQ